MESMDKGINVLSLFDGMSCGQIALERVGVKVGKYYASEIDKYAIQVTQNNYPDTVQLGDVTKWREWDIDFIITINNLLDELFFDPTEMDYSEIISAFLFAVTAYFNRRKWVNK